MTNRHPPNAIVVGLQTLVVTGVIGLSSWLAIVFARPPGGVTTIWVASGLLTGILLTSSHRLWLVYIVAGLAGNLIARAVVGDPMFEVGIRGVASTLEACTVAYALRYWVGDIADPSKFPAVSRVAMASTLIACVTSALIVATGSFALDRGSFTPVFANWFASHTLGIVIVASVFVVATNRDVRFIGRPRQRLSLALVVCLIAATTVFVFSQSRYPLLFLIYPPLLLATFRHRYDGIAIGIVVVAIIALAETLSGHGPLAATTGSSLQERAWLWQLFIATTCLSTFPVVVILTERVRLTTQLRDSEQNYRTLADYSRDIVVRMRMDGRKLYVSPSIKEVLGWEPGELAARPWDLVHADDRTVLVNTINALDHTGDATTVIYRALHKKGHHVWIEAHVRLVPGAQPGFSAEIIYAGRDISKRMFAERELRRNEQRLRTIADALPPMIGYADAMQRFVFVNAAYERVYGRGQSDMIGRPMREVLGEVIYGRRLPYIDRVLRGERVTFEDEEQTADEYQCMEITYIPQQDEDNTRVLGMHIMVQDITAKKLQERSWIQAAQVDGLTGLANRTMFLARLNRALARSHDQQSMLAVMYVDIDRFKQINDTHGHSIGDAILKSFASRLSGVLRTSDVIGRMGGDEFTVFAEDVGRPQDMTAAAEKIVTAMRSSFVLSEALTLSVTTSVGLALTQKEPDMTAADLLERADRALYEAKAAGRDGYRVAGPCFAENAPPDGESA